MSKHLAVIRRKLGSISLYQAARDLGMTPAELSRHRITDEELKRIKQSQTPKAKWKNIKRNGQNYTL